jgi:2-iminobutanoate/2-iminopropanoate deaminase
MATNMKPITVLVPELPAMTAKISHAKVYNGVCYVSGMVGRDPATGTTIVGGIVPQTRQTLKHLKTVLEAAGTTMDRVIGTTCYMSDRSQFAEFNGVWESYFPNDPPTRVCIQVVLGADFLIEIDAIAAMP